MPPAADLRAVSVYDLEEATSFFERLFHGPLPGDLDSGQGFFPLFEGRDALVDKANEMVETFNSSRWRLGLISGLMIKSAIERVLDELPRLVERLDYALDHYAPVVSLFLASAEWTTEVMTPLSEIAGTIDRDIDNTSLRDWEDDARAVYSEDVVPHQHSAVGAARDNAVFISNLLGDIGLANTEFATELIRTVAGIYAEIVKIVLELASLVGSPFAIQDAAGLVAEIVNAFAGVVTSAIDDLAAAVERIGEAENELSNHTYFPGGDWPEAVTRA